MIKANTNEKLCILFVPKLSTLASALQEEYLIMMHHSSLSCPQQVFCCWTIQNFHRKSRQYGSGKEEDGGDHVVDADASRDNIFLVWPCLGLVQVFYNSNSCIGR